LPSQPHHFDAAQKSNLRQRLLGWYGREQRMLPWRATRDPYRIWISEIMLQQTRVGVVRQRYEEFLERFPDVRGLARARLDRVLAAWSGLGYYRRARALHQAARQIAREHGGKLPQASEKLRALPGIGRYTAAALASIAFGEVVAVVDGNVERVLRRLLGWRTQPMARIWDAAEHLLSRKRPGDFNQAMMELGATVCLPAQPRCGECPLRRWCATQGALPSAPTVARKRQSIAYGLAQRNASVFLVRRSPLGSLMPGMWELPEVALNGHHVEFRLRHAITATDYQVTVARLRAHDVPASGGRWIKGKSVLELPLTGLTRRILRLASVI
jgi:A/G-specific adenine glycosylase